MNRRNSLKLILSGSVIMFAGLLKPLVALAKWNKDAFSATDLKTALAARYPDQDIISSTRIRIGVQAEVENGAVVPIKIETDLPEPESIAILVDRNPNPLIANFDLFPGCEGFVSTRIKIENPSAIMATVKSEGMIYSTKTSIIVHEGGCG